MGKKCASELIFRDLLCNLINRFGGWLACFECYVCVCVCDSNAMRIEHNIVFYVTKDHTPFRLWNALPTDNFSSIEMSRAWRCKMMLFASLFRLKWKIGKLQMKYLCNVIALKCKIHVKGNIYTMKNRDEFATTHFCMCV